LINKAGGSALNLLENLLEWSRSQQNKIPFNPQKNNMHELADETFMLVNQNAKEKQITVDLNISKEINFESDSEMIKTISRNI